MPRCLGIFYFLRLENTLKHKGFRGIVRFVETVTQYIIYAAAFVSIYVEVFLLVTFIEERKKIVYRTGSTVPARYPTVTVIVPCWNEAKTLEGTIESLRGLDYPKDRLTIFLVDDGSTDTTWEIMQKYEHDPQIRIFQKENGGKHTAMNLGIKESTSELIGCLDADSFVDRHALARIVTYFDDPKTMSVSPSIIVHKPKTLIQRAQSVEYQWAVYIKKVLGLLGGIHVTPGPFSIYRKAVFETIGYFRKAHNTEDMEIAFRMQKNHMKIEQCNDAYVYTVTPPSVRKLYRQRLRWIHGFIRNTFDYRAVLFKESYGTFALFTVPSGIVSIIAATLLFSLFVINAARFIYEKIHEFISFGYHFSHAAFHFNWYIFSAHTSMFLLVILYGLLIVAMLIGTAMAEGRFKLSIHLISFIIIYQIIAPIWLMNAIYKAAFTRGTSWR